MFTRRWLRGESRHEVSPKQDGETIDNGRIVSSNFLYIYLSVNTDNLISRVLTTIKKKSAWEK